MDDGEAATPATFSRRRFVRGSILAAGSLSATGLLLRASGAAGNATSVTTLTDVLEALPATLPDGITPGVLLELARRDGTTPEALAMTIGEEVGADAVLYLAMLDDLWLNEVPFGRQPLDRRREALEWATRQRAQLPDLGPRRAGATPPNGSSANDDPSSPDEPWRVVANLLLEYAAAVAEALTIVQAQMPDSPEGADEPVGGPADATTEEP